MKGKKKTPANKKGQNGKDPSGGDSGGQNRNQKDNGKGN